MGTLPEPNDVDIVVSGGEPTPDALRETAEFIERSRRRPEHAAEVEEARKTLEALGIKPESYGMDDPQALLAHWKRCVEDLTRNTPKPPNGQTG
jgi:hypothetical protein